MTSASSASVMISNHAHHLLHAADGAREVGGSRGLTFGDATHQVDRAALGDHLEGVSLQVLRVERGSP